MSKPLFRYQTKGFQSLNRAYKRSDAMINTEPSTLPGRFNPSIGLTSVPTTLASLAAREQVAFQSLNRAYKRSDGDGQLVCTMQRLVSIPQSGLQAFRRRVISMQSSDARRFNPSIGLTSVPTHDHPGRQGRHERFQSLNRAYKRSDIEFLFRFVAKTSGFNPSIGLTSVPTGCAR